MRLFISLVCLFAASTLQSNLQAAIVYSSFDGLNQTTNSFTFTTTAPRNFMADGFSTVPLSVNGIDWSVQNIGVRFVTAVPGTFSNVTMRVRVYDDWNPATATGSVFTNLVSDVVWSLGNVSNSGTGASFFTLTLPYAAQGLSFLLDDGQNMGISVEILSNGVANQNLTLLLRSVAGDPGLPAVGTSSNLWYRDADGNGVIEQSDGRTFAGTNSNVHFQIDALEITAVPEPGSMALVGSLLVLPVVRRVRAKRCSAKSLLSTRPRPIRD